MEGSGFRSVLQKFGNGYNIVIHVDGETRFNLLIVAAFIGKYNLEKKLIPLMMLTKHYRTLNCSLIGKLNPNVCANNTALINNSRSKKSIELHNSIICCIFVLIKAHLVASKINR